MQKEKNDGGRRRTTDDGQTENNYKNPEGRWQSLLISIPTEEILAVQADRQKNDRGWGTDRTDEYNVNTTAERYEETEHYVYTGKTS